MRNLLFASCTLGLVFAGPVMAQSIGSSGSASSSASQPQYMGARTSSPQPMGMTSRASVTPNLNGTISSGGFTTTTQVNQGTPGQMGIATSTSGGVSVNTTFNSPYGALSGSQTMVMSKTIGIAVGGGSFNVGSGVVSTPSGTTTTSYGGQYNVSVNGPNNRIQ